MNKLLLEMINYYQGDPSRIQHFLKVYEFSRLIGEEENIDKDKQFILETAAIVHDIGIKAAERKYGKSNGIYQEELGPGLARDMLSKLGYDNEVIERVAYLVGHHHTYTNIDDVDYQILVEADFLVNIHEDNITREAGINALNKIFKTPLAIKICKTMYNI